MAAQPFTGGVSRRQAIAVTLAAAVTPTSLSSEPAIDPHIEWIEEWSELDRIFWENDPEPDGLVQEFRRVGDLIMDTPALTTDGMLAKIRFVKASFLDDGVNDPPTQLLEQLEAFLGGGHGL
ncbi:MAG: hypothetical protein ACR2RE_18265 [Geminicoccaceae bacterium]